MRCLIRNIAIVPILAVCCGTAYADGSFKINPSSSIYADEKKAGLLQPEGVGCSHPSTLVIADSGNGRLVLCSIAGEAVVPVKEIRLPQISYPIRAQLNSKGEILALDGKMRRIVRISPSGEFSGYMEIVGAPGSESIVPRSFVIDSKDNVYVIDFYSGRVLLLGATGKYLKEIAVPPDQRSLSDIAVDAAGTIFLIDGVAGRIYSAGKDSSEFAVLAKDIKDYSDFPAGLAVDNKGRIFVSDKNGSKVVVIGKDGSFQGQQLGMGWKEGLLRYPSQICVSGTGKLFIADRGNNRIQIFSISE